MHWQLLSEINGNLLIGRKKNQELVLSSAYNFVFPGGMYLKVTTCSPLNNSLESCCKGVSLLAEFSEIDTW